MKNGRLVHFESEERAGIRRQAEVSLGEAKGFVLMTWGDDGVPIVTIAGIGRSDIAYMACYLSAMAVSPDFNAEGDEEFDA